MRETHWFHSFVRNYDSHKISKGISYQILEETSEQFDAYITFC